MKKLALAIAVALSLASLSAAAQNPSRGADNFYKSESVSVEKVSFNNQSVQQPAAINTELLSTIRDKASREQMQSIYDRYGLDPERIASVVAFAIDQPDDTTINKFTVGPANQPW